MLIEQVKDQGVFFEILNETITNFIEVRGSIQYVGSSGFDSRTISKLHRFV